MKIEMKERFKKVDMRLSGVLKEKMMHMKEKTYVSKTERNIQKRFL